MAAATMRAIARMVSDYNDEEFERCERLAAMWQLCPLYVTLQRGGDRVVLDGCGRPIIRVFADERTEILPPDAEYHAIRGLTRLHNDFGIMPGEKAARDHVRRYIETYKIASELRRRWELQQRGELTGGWRR